MKKQVKSLRTRVEKYEAVAADIRAKAVAEQGGTGSTSEDDASGEEEDDPDDLTAIRGIGPAIADKLTGAGIRTFSALAEATDEQLEEAKKGLSKTAKLKGWRKSAVDAIAAMASAPQVLQKDEAETEEQEADQLTDIGGLTSAVAKTLKNAGIRTFEALVALTIHQLEELTEGLAEKAEKHRWQKQAQTLLDAKIERQEEAAARAASGKPSDEEEDRVEHDEKVASGMASAAEKITAADIWCLLDAERTDLGNADRMLVKYGERVLDVDGIGVMAWTGVRWFADPQGASLARTAQDTARSVTRDLSTARILHEFAPDLVKYLPLTKKDARIMREGDKDGAGRVRDPENVRFSIEELAGWAKTSQSQKSISAIEKLAKAHLVATATDMDAQNHLLGVRNGAVDLMTGKLLPPSQDLMISKICRTTYDPDAKCPEWIKFLEDIFNKDRALISYIQRWLGYIATGETDEQKFIFFEGVGSNGKGVLTLILDELLGDYTTTIPKSYLMKQRFSSNNGGTDEILANLRGARLIHASEGDPDDIMDEGRLKHFSGEGIVTAAKKFKSTISFLPCGKLVFDTNDLPRIQSQGDAIWRRVKVVNFPNSYANPGDKNYKKGISKPKDSSLKNKLRKEFPGILAWIVRGAVGWYGLDRKEEDQRHLGEEPACVSARIDDYQVETDPTGDFLAQCCDISKHASCQAGELYEAYCAYIKSNAAGYTISNRAFGDILTKEKKFKAEKKSGYVVRHGLCLNGTGRAYLATSKDRVDLDRVRSAAIAQRKKSADVIEMAEKKVEKRLFAFGSQIVEAATIEDFPEIFQRAIRDAGAELPVVGHSVDVGNAKLIALYK